MIADSTGTSAIGIYLGSWSNRTGGKNVILDLNGHTYTHNGPDVSGAFILAGDSNYTEGSSLTVIDNSESKTGKITSNNNFTTISSGSLCSFELQSGTIENTANNSTALQVTGSGYGKISGGTLSATGDYGMGVYIYAIEERNGKLDISKGTITGDWGIITKDKSAVSMTGGTISADISAVYADDESSFTISAGTIEGDWGIEGYGSSILEINGGTITTTEGAVYTEGESSLTISAGTVEGDWGIEAAGDSTVEIKGGTINAAAAAIFLEENADVTVSDGKIKGNPIIGKETEGENAFAGKCSVTGGIFTIAPDNTYVANGYSVVGIDDKTYLYGVAKPELTIRGGTTKSFDGTGVTLTAAAVPENMKASGENYKIAYSYRWAKSTGGTYSDISGADRASYTTGENVADSGTYKCTVTTGNKTLSDTAAVTISPADMTVSGVDYKGSYDGDPHGIGVTVTKPASGYTVKYGKTEGTYDLDKSPEITDASDSLLKVFFKVTAGNYNSFEGSATVTITKADMTVSGVDYEGSYDSDPHGIGVTVTKPAKGYTVKYGKTEGTYDLDKSPEITDASDSPLKVFFKVIADNYNPFEGSATVTITKADPVEQLDFMAPVGAKGLEYNGSAQELLSEPGRAIHDVGTFYYNADPEETVSKGDPEESGYSDSTPKRTHAGEYEVYYFIGEKDNYNALGSAEEPANANDPIMVTISPKPLDPSMISISEESFVYDGTEKEVSYTVSDPGLEDTDWKAVTEETKGSQIGTYSICIKATEDGNYSSDEPICRTWQIINPDQQEMTFYRFEDQQFMPSCDHCRLPNTGFTSRVSMPFSVETAALEDLNMIIQIPALNITADLADIPFTGETWEAEGLGSRAGLLNGSAIPGQGYSIVAAHNTLNETEVGPFALLSEASVNDTVYVTNSENEMLRFTVYANELVAPDGFQAMMSIASGHPNSLILVTCENESIDGGYLDRRAVFAEPAL